jgi:hypothetical protein
VTSTGSANLDDRNVLWAAGKYNEHHDGDEDRHNYLDEADPQAQGRQPNETRAAGMCATTAQAPHNGH